MGSLIEYMYRNDLCVLRLNLHDSQLLNVMNTDLYVDDHHIFIFVDSQLFKFYTERKIDIGDNTIIVRYNSIGQYIELQFPCMPHSLSEISAAGINCSREIFALWKLTRITDRCLCAVDESVPSKFVPDFGYGFSNKFKGSTNFKISSAQCITEPQLLSPIRRTINRELDEMHSFSRDQYKADFCELQVPDGHEDPMKFNINFCDKQRTAEEEIMWRISCERGAPFISNGMQVKCDLVNILLAICYDVRSTYGDATCESAWTRSTLSATLVYFAVFDNVKDSVISFIRRSLIFPLYRNYDFSICCVKDAVQGLRNREWLLKQFLLTHELFNVSDNYHVFNHWYIKSYLRFLCDETICPQEYLCSISQELENLLQEINKNDIDLDLMTIEADLMKELLGFDMSEENISGEEQSTEDETDNVDAEIFAKDETANQTSENEIESDLRNLKI